MATWATSNAPTRRSKAPQCRPGRRRGASPPLSRSLQAEAPVSSPPYPMPSSRPPPLRQQPYPRRRIGLASPATARSSWWSTTSRPTGKRAARIRGPSRHRMCARSTVGCSGTKSGRSYDSGDAERRSTWSCRTASCLDKKGAPALVTWQRWTLHAKKRKEREKENPASASCNIARLQSVTFIGVKVTLHWKSTDTPTVEPVGFLSNHNHNLQCILFMHNCEIKWNETNTLFLIFSSQRFVI